MDRDNQYIRDAKEILKSLTLLEKCSLLSGYDFWHTKAIEGKLPSLMMSDGPTGLRKQRPDAKTGTALTQTYPATCFPTAATLGNTFNPELVYEVAQAIGTEARAAGVGLLLAPGVNIKRDPLCGRNFEYFSEDPLVSGVMGTAYVKGVQSVGVGATVKHFALNNQENHRMTISAICDTRAKREIYLRAFERVVKEASPAALMCSYNRIDGIYASENAELLQNILVDEWGYEGLTVSDWAAVNDRVASLCANLNLEMPGGLPDNDNYVYESVKNGKLDEQILDRNVLKIIELVLRFGLLERIDFEQDRHRDIARRAAEEGIVLLKNDGVLPLAKSGKTLIVGDLFTHIRYQGSGSSIINPERLIAHEVAFKEYGVDYDFVAGYNRRTELADFALCDAAVSVAGEYDNVVVFAGLPATFESEGYDRSHMRIPQNQVDLIEQLCEVNKNIIVVLFGGSVMELPFADKVAAIIYAALGGQEGAYAIPRVLFGDLNPSGKLSETWAYTYQDYPCSGLINAPVTAEYRDSIFVGYRYFATAMPPRYAFGHGLSYTKFQLSHLVADKKSLSKGETLTLKVTLKNLGERLGGEVVQVYSTKPDSSVLRPLIEIKGFKKAFLNGGEQTDLKFSLDYDVFSVYDAAKGRWATEGGKYTLLVGTASDNLPLSVDIDIEGEALKFVYPDSYKRLVPFCVTDEDFAVLYGRDVPSNYAPKKPYNYNTEIGDIKHTLIGRAVYKTIMPDVTEEQLENDEALEVTLNMFRYGLIYNPLRAIALCSGGILDFAALDSMLLFLNGKRLRSLRGLRKLSKRMRNFEPPQ